MHLALVYETLPQGELVAELFDLLSDDVKSDVYEGAVEQNLSQLRGAFSFDAAARNPQRV